MKLTKRINTSFFNQSPSFSMPIARDEIPVFQATYMPIIANIMPHPRY